MADEERLHKIRAVFTRALGEVQGRHSRFKMELTVDGDGAVLRILEPAGTSFTMRFAVGSDDTIQASDANRWTKGLGKVTDEKADKAIASAITAAIEREFKGP